MELLKHTAKIREYCDYIDEHVRNVERAWKALQESCKDMSFMCCDARFFAIAELVKAHDLSKVSPEEFIQYQRNFYPVGEKDKEGFASAWRHHEDANPHHWQNWTKKASVYTVEVEIDCVCMVIDWMAMGYKFGDTAESYYRANADKIKLPEWAVRFIGEIFERLSGKGEA